MTDFWDSYTSDAPEFDWGFEPVAELEPGDDEGGDDGDREWVVVRDGVIEVTAMAVGAALERGVVALRPSSRAAGEPGAARWRQVSACGCVAVWHRVGDAAQCLLVDARLVGGVEDDARVVDVVRRLIDERRALA